MCMYVCMCIAVHMNAVYFKVVYACVCVYVFVRMFVYWLVFVWVCVCVCVVYMCVCFLCAYKYIHTYIGEWTSKFDKAKREKDSYVYMYCMYVFVYSIRL